MEDEHNDDVNGVSINSNMPSEVHETTLLEE